MSRTSILLLLDKVGENFDIDVKECRNSLLEVHV